MLILLPPSEGKSAPESGPALDLSTLSMPGLTDARRRVIRALLQVCAGRPTRARTILGLSPLQESEVERNRQLLTAPTAPAVDVYTGVVYEALGYQSLSKAAQGRLRECVVISSALWGAVRLNDQIPAYRCSADVSLPRLGSLATFWRKPLAKLISEEAAWSGVVFDLRSAGYARMWTPGAELVEHTVVGRVLQRQPDGATKVVSHFNKATKGQLVRSLAQQRAHPNSVNELTSLIERLGYTVDLIASAGGKPARLDIVVEQVL